MTHPFHAPRDCRYTGAVTIPRVGGCPRPAAALVAHHPKQKVRVDPMYQALDAHPSQQPVSELRLLPVVFVDFYQRC